MHDFVLSTTFVILQNVPGKKGKNDSGVFICINMWGNFREEKCQEDLGLFRGVLRHFHQYFVAVSFIGGGNRSTWRKPPTFHKSLTNTTSGLWDKFHLILLVYPSGAPEFIPGF